MKFRWKVPGEALSLEMTLKEAKELVSTLGSMSPQGFDSQEAADQHEDPKAVRDIEYGVMWAEMAYEMWAMFSKYGIWTTQSMSQTAGIEPLMKWLAAYDQEYCDLYMKRPAYVKPQPSNLKLVRGSTGFRVEALNPSCRRELTDEQIGKINRVLKRMYGTFIPPREEG